MCARFHAFVLPGVLRRWGVLGLVSRCVGAFRYLRVCLCERLEMRGRLLARWVVPRSRLVGFFAPQVLWVKRLGFGAPGFSGSDCASGRTACTFGCATLAHAHGTCMHAARMNG